MLTNTSRWSHARGNEVVPYRWQATRRTTRSWGWTCLVTVDGCNVKAPSGGEVAGISPVDRGKIGTNAPC